MTTKAEGLRRNWIRVPLSAFLLWFASVSIPQGWHTLVTEEDWSDAYLRSTATIVSGREELRAPLTSYRTAYYICEPIVEYEFEGETYRAEPNWIFLDDSNDSRGDSCADERVGEEIEIWIDAAIDGPVMLRPGNKASQPFSGMLNIGFGLLALFGIWRLWRKDESRQEGAD